MEKYILNYKSPAHVWEEALPIGNGCIGAMIYGSMDVERFALNHDCIWSGSLRDTTNKNANNYVERVRELIFLGKYVEAKEIMDKNMLGEYTESYLPAGDLYIQINNSGKFKDYNRELDINRAVHKVSFRTDRGKTDSDELTFTRESFVSYEKNALITKISSNSEKQINITIFLNSQVKNKIISCVDGELILEAVSPYHVEPSYIRNCDNPIVYDESKETIRYRIMVKVAVKNGKTKNESGSIVITSADEVVIYTTIDTSFVAFNQLPQKDIEVEKIMEEAMKGSYDTVLDAHIKDYTHFFNRVDLKLAENIEKPTDERLKKVSEDEALHALMFQYGRYLCICSSREGTQPANLQGIWNKDMRAAWSSNLTTNINAQMNYWHVESCNLQELHKPLIKAIEEMMISGSHTAHVNYNIDGFVVHHNADIWRLTTPVKDNSSYAFWPMGSGWLCRHLHEHYLYEPNINFLKEIAYPITKEAVKFYMKWLVPNQEGYLVTCPSTSPENGFLTETGEKAYVSMASTMDITIIKELFKNFIYYEEILQINDEISLKVKESLEKLPPYKIGGKGQLLEWYYDYAEFELGHRHVSHLYGLYPGAEILVDNKALTNACKKSLEIRMENGGGHTGWSCAWLINLYARLKDGEKAYQYTKMLLEKSVYSNLFDAHPPFQIDGNFGYTSGVAEMLLQSHEEYIHILPALPKKWANGYVKGLRARGGYTIDIEWVNNKASKIFVKSDVDKECKIKVNGEIQTIYTNKNIVY